MIWIFVVLLIAVTLVLQHRAAGRAAIYIRADHKPETNLAEPGEGFDLILTVGNAGRMWLPFVRLREKLPPEILPQDLSAAEKEPLGGHSVSFTAWLAPGKQQTFRLPVRIEQRGRYLLPPMMVAAGDFLGIEEEEHPYPLFREVVIPPKEAPETAVNQVLGGFLGDVSVRRYLYEDPVLIAGFHEYSGHEPMRSISWSRSLRSNSLMVKNYDHTAESSVTVLLDVAECTDALLERCCSLTRTVCRLLEDAGTEYSFASNAELAGNFTREASLASGLGQRHFSALLECLGRATGRSAKTCEALFVQAVDGQTARGCILITSNAATADLLALRRWKGAGNTLLVLTGEEAQT